MSSSVTPSSRSTTTRTTLRRPAGVTTRSSSSYPAASTTGSIQPASAGVAGSARRLPRAAATGSSSGSVAVTSCSRRTTTRRPGGPGAGRAGDGGKSSGYRPPARRGAATDRPPAVRVRGGRYAWTPPGRLAGARSPAAIRPGAVPAGRMGPMPATSPLATVALRRRTLLAASAAGLGALLVGCTSDGGTAQVTPQQADELAGQVSTQEALVAAFAAAGTADPALGAQVAPLADQVQQQLERLKAAAPGATSSGG